MAIDDDYRRGVRQLDRLGIVAGCRVSVTLLGFRSVPGMPSSPDAAEKIREKQAAGTLPNAGGISFSGYGTGQICDGCDTPILPAEMEYEVEPRDRRIFRFHVRCVLLWQMYGRQRGG
jgi:hypothetical protein